MFDTVLAKVFGTKHDREAKRLQPRVEAINALEPAISSLSDEQLQAKTPELKQRLANGETLDDILEEAFAVCREAGKRVLGMRHYDVQLIGGMVLHEGKIAEMKTGEGKTLVATLPVYLNALDGKGVHVVTVNDYLARRDSEWMGKLYGFLGLTVGVVVHDVSEEERRAGYLADITYGTNNEFGFDYLRDNMKFDLGDCVQRGHNFAIVDEVDSILIDEARTPLIISGPSEESTDKYYKINRVIPLLERGEVIEGHDDPRDRTYTGDYIIEEKHRTAFLTEQGEAKVEQALGIDNINDLKNYEVKHCVEQGLKAHVLFHRDQNYVVKDGQVIIVDEFTGRLMPGRRWSDGLHQAVEAKERVKIERENQTLATITFQNYFRMYDKLAGMTGTADTEAAEFSKIYDLEVVVIPTNKPLARKEFADIVYRTEDEKWRNAAKEIKEFQERGQPVLVGTVSIEKSEKLSKLLKKQGVRHQVLNAKQHEKEAKIIAQAGRKGAVTVSTNMAGRGTDILLGGNPESLADDHFRKMGENPEEISPAEYAAIVKKFKADTDAERDEVKALGGLHVLGTERHESRRIDNQLRGRAGRQGDPGSSRFYLSLQDDLLRIFGGERIQNLMLKLGMEEDVPIESGMISKRIEAAQKAVEAQHFESRKHILEYDDVMNKQREAVYGLRKKLLNGVNQKEAVLDRIGAVVGSLVESRCPAKTHPDAYEIPELCQDILTQFGVSIEHLEFDDLDPQGIADEITDYLSKEYQQREDLIGAERLRYSERIIMLQIIDQQWKDHLLQMDHLKEGIGLRGYGQKDPLIEYKKESFTIFEAMMNRFEEETLKFLFHLQPPEGGGATAQRAQQGRTFEVREEEAEPAANGTNGAAHPEAPSAMEATIDEFTRDVRRKKERELAQVSLAGSGGQSASAVKQVISKKVGRNDPCPCGSGKKYKKCCGATA
ncbi:MAG: preprotein translocase subunit SecA [Acidobacteria bacterium]|nr:preprotein translocase subunit SecA [Acidobacteriota bacterium]